MTDRDPGSALLAPAVEPRTRTLLCPHCRGTVEVALPSVTDLTLTTFIAVCDVLVMKALEKMGNYIVRAERRRFNELKELGEPIHLAHTIWPVSDEIVSKALKGAWDVVPLVLDTHSPYQFDAEKAVAVLDQYVHDLVVTGSDHDLNVLAYRVRTGLGLPVFAVVTGEPPGGGSQ